MPNERRRDVTLRRVCLFVALALPWSSAFADCREASGGRLQGLQSAVIWHARTACGGSTLLWFQSFAGAQGTKPVLRVDDLLIIPEAENPQTLSLLAPQEVACRHAAGGESLVIAAGEWSPRAGQGERQPVNRAWRVNAATRQVEELPPGNVTCVVR
jgi:hypothetical protein